MKPLRAILKVARRDFVERGRSKTFLISTLLIVALILGVGPLLANGFSQAPPIAIGVVGAAPEALTSALDGSAAALDVEYELTRYDDRSTAESGLRSGDVAVVIDDDGLLWEQEVAPFTNALVSTALQAMVRQETITELGLTPDQVAALLAPRSPRAATLDPPDPERGIRQGAAYAGALLLFMSIVLFGQFVLLGVLEEKSNRVAEVVLSRVRPVELLSGKVLGIGVLGFAQIAVIGASIVALISIIDVADLPNLSEIGIPIVVGVIGWYVLGFAFYSALYAAAGSLVSRQEEVQGVGWIPMIGLLPAYFLSLEAALRPERLIVKIGSMFPGTAPLVMPVRAASGTVASWQVAVAILVTIASTYLLMRLAARIYKGGILRTSRVKLLDAYRSAEG